MLIASKPRYGVLPRPLFLIAVLFLVAVLINGTRPLTVLAEGMSPYNPVDPRIHSPEPQIPSVGISAERVIWTATELYPLGGHDPRRYTPSRLFSYNLHTEHLGTAVHSRFGAIGGIYLYQIDRDRVAYLDTGVDPFRWIIVVLDLSTGAQRVIARIGSDEAPGTTPSLALSTTFLLWVDQQWAHNSISSSVYDYNLATHRSHLLLHTLPGDSITHLAIDGTLCVWEEDRSSTRGYSSSVVLYDLTTRRRIALNAARNASQPAIRWPFLAWKTGTSSAPGRVVLYDLRNRRLVPTPAGPGTFSPTIGDGFVAWSSGANGVIQGFDLSRSRRIALPSLDPDTGFSAPAAAGRLLAYAYTTHVPVRHGGPSPQGYIQVLPVH